MSLTESDSLVSQERARQIMGRNFFGIEEAIHHFKITPEPTELAALSFLEGEVPFSEEVLEFYKDTHILIAVFRLSILDIKDKIDLFENFRDHKEAFAKDRGKTSWYLVRKTSVPGSTSKSWNEQQAMLPKNEETLSAQVMAYTIIGHYLATGERLFDDVQVRTSSVDSGGHRVNVGPGHFSLHVNTWWDDGPHIHIGVSSSVRSRPHIPHFSSLREGLEQCLGVPEH